jgi:hypothetical protein
MLAKLGRLRQILRPPLLKQSHLQLLWNDLRRRRGDIMDTEVHLAATMNWILESWKATSESGSSAAYSLIYKWLPPYPETTGYIIPTLWDYYALTREEEYRRCALSLADWEIEIQLSNGAVRGGYFGVDPFGVFTKTDVPVVFNTGMVLLGWARTYRETHDERYRYAMQRAGRWLTAVQEPGGYWLKGNSESTTSSFYSYYTMVCWGLLEAWRCTSDEKLRATALRGLEWVLSVQARNGFFLHMSFDEAKPPLLHTIGYTLQGILESGIILNEEKYVVAVLQPAELLMRKYELTGRFAGRYTPEWKPAARYTCLTGNAQMATIFSNLSDRTDDLRYFNTALKLNDELKRQQPLWSNNPGIRGGVRGSYPIWEEYSRLNFPNWAAKFFADALMLEIRILAKLEEKVREKVQRQGENK